MKFVPVQTELETANGNSPSRALMPRHMPRFKDNCQSQGQEAGAAPKEAVCVSAVNYKQKSLYSENTATDMLEKLKVQRNHIV